MSTVAQEPAVRPELVAEAKAILDRYPGKVPVPVDAVVAKERSATAGTLKAIERASHADLAKVPGVSAETARKIYDFFHEAAG